MCKLDLGIARFPLCSCCQSGYPEEKKNTMALAPQLQGGMGTRAGGARMNLGIATPSPTRFPSAQFPTRPISPGPAIVSRPQSPGPPICALLTTPNQAPPERRELAVTVGVNVIPHPEKVAKGGEDAYFTSAYKGGVLGVADGVSGWAAENVDPALFSREFMAHAAAAVGSDEVKDDPKRLLAKAHAATCSVGAATAIVAILDERGTLHVANLGDCGLRLVRGGKVVHATAPQQHYFDCPYQFSSENAQTADDAEVYELEVLEGDTIVMGSDGLFDNVYDYDIESTVKILSGPDEDSANRLAMALATLASKHARDRNYNSPYAVEAVLQGHDLPWYAKMLGRKLTGGKLDDITVVVGHVVKSPGLYKDVQVELAQEEKLDKVQEKQADSVVELQVDKVVESQDGMDSQQQEVEQVDLPTTEGKADSKEPSL